MTKDLIYTNGQEGYVDLNILLSYRVYTIEDVKGVEVEHTIGRDTIGRQGNKPGNKLKIHRPDRYYKLSDAYKRLLILKASMNNIVHNLPSIHNKDIEEIRRSINLTMKKCGKTKYRFAKINTLNKTLRKLVKSKIKENVGELDLKVLKKLLRNVPKKYKRIEEEVIQYRGLGAYNHPFTYRYYLRIMKLNTKCIPYLEQQYQLMRIRLTKNELDLLEAFKEAMRIQDDKMSFDDYIDNWAEKLLGGKSVG